MADILAKIAAYKREEIAAAKLARPLRRSSARQSRKRRRAAFCAPSNTGLAAGEYALIAEIKKASPSKGLIRADFDPPALATAYQAGGATCLSVLTDAPSFQGNLDYLRAARAAVRCRCCARISCTTPIRWRRRARSAPIAFSSSWPRSTMPAPPSLKRRRQRSDMDALVEVHDEDELERALRLQSRLIGINNRNLKTFETTLATCEQLAPRVPPAASWSAKAAFSAPTISHGSAKAGISTFLVGESLMRQDDVAAATRALLGAAIVQRVPPAISKLSAFSVFGVGVLECVGVEVCTGLIGCRGRRIGLRRRIRWPRVPDHVGYTGRN